MSHPLAIVFFLVGFLGKMSAVTAGDDNATNFKITTKRGNDRVEVRADKDKTAFIVKSPFGMSNAAIERTGEKWPDGVVLRFRLKSLESFRATSGEVTLDAAVSIIQNGKVRLWKDGKEDTMLDAKSKYWMEIRMIGGDGEPARAIPLKDGYFEMALPKAFFEGNPKTITVSWIDFYRN